MRKNKGQSKMSLSVLASVGVSFVVIAIVLAFGANILQSLQTDSVTGVAGCNSTHKTACGVDYNATTYGLSAMNTMTSWLPTLALVVIAAIIIGIVVGYLATRGKG